MGIPTMEGARTCRLGIGVAEGAGRATPDMPDNPLIAEGSAPGFRVCFALQHDLGNSFRVTRSVLWLALAAMGLAAVF